ncbi:MAG TPA: hypothetical protein VNV18_06235 [Stellaceae bacterium]|nr:hypothetical protein [Stellaceae bacterium]
MAGFVVFFADDFGLAFRLVVFLTALCGADLVGATVGPVGVVGAIAGAFAAGAGATPEGA